MILRQGHAHWERLAVQLGQHLKQLVFEPGMQHGIGRPKHSLGADGSDRGTKQGQQLGRSSVHMCMRLSGGMAVGMPAGPWLGNGLIGTGFILAPHRQPRRFRFFVRPLDQQFFS
jgi:hypothetical protein